MRTGTANLYNNALEQLFKRQSELAGQQEKLSTQKRVNRASDDPVAIAQAERAMVRLGRVEVDQRALEAQRSALTTAEHVLADAGSLARGARDLVVAAGNATLSPQDRTTLARQMADLRDQLFVLSNSTDSNGVPLFGGLGSATAPFADVPSGVQFQAIPGQRSTTTTNLPGAMNGQAIWMNLSSGNGTFEVGLAPGNTGTLWTDQGTVTSPGALTGNNYSVSFSVVAGVTTYDVVNTTTATAVAIAQPYVAGAPIQFDGLSIVARGIPANGDTVTVAPSIQTNIFKVLDDTIASITNAKGDARLSQAVALQLVQIDTGMEQLQAARSQTGDWLNRADSITRSQELRTISLESDQSRAVDLDAVKGISDFNKFKIGYDAALQSYAQMQRLSLFNFIN